MTNQMYVVSLVNPVIICCELVVTAANEKAAVKKASAMLKAASPAAHRTIENITVTLATAKKQDAPCMDCLQAASMEPWERAIYYNAGDLAAWGLLDQQTANYFNNYVLDYEEDNE